MVVKYNKHGNQCSLSHPQRLHLIFVKILFLFCIAFNNNQVIAEQYIQTYIGSSNIKITEKNFDFGDKLFVLGEPADNGYLDWRIINGEISVTLDGFLHLDDVQGLCGRIRMDYYTGKHIYWTTKYSQNYCPSDDKHHSWHLTLNPYTSSKVNEVKISIEKLTATSDWTTVGSQTEKLITTHSNIKITESGFDLGGANYAAGAPTNSADVSWIWTGGQIKPHLTGTLHIDNAATACARIYVKYYRYDNELLAEHDGGKVCSPDNRHNAWTVDFEPFADNKLTNIKVSLQTLSVDNTWHTIGTDSASYVTGSDLSLCGGSGENSGVGKDCWRRKLK